MGDADAIYVFELDDHYCFAQYFDGGPVFDELREYYVEAAYRFEVPADAFDAVAATLWDYGFEPTLVDDPEPFCVVIHQYEPHAAVLEEAVASWTRRDHRFFLMRSPVAVEQAVERGATPVSDTEFEAGI